MKTTRRIITIAIALALIFAFCAPSFALQTTGFVPVNDGASKYTQGADSLYEQDGTFTVHLSIHSGKRAAYGPAYGHYDVTMGTANATDELYTVKDVLEKAQYLNNNLIFTIVTDNNYHTSYLQSVKDTYVSPYISFSAETLKRTDTSSTYYCGWMFRINGMLPYYEPSPNADPVACLISNAYVTDGDTIDLYYANVYERDNATKVRAIDYIGISNGGYKFQLLEAECYMEYNDSEWTTPKWTPVKNETCDIWKDSGTISISTGNDGCFTLTGLTGTHSLQFKTTLDNGFRLSSNTQVVYGVPDIAGMYFIHTF